MVLPALRVGHWLNARYDSTYCGEPSSRFMAHLRACEPAERARSQFRYPSRYRLTAMPALLDVLDIVAEVVASAISS